VKPYYVNAKGVKVVKAEASCVRYDCDCGAHRWDVPIDLVTAKTAAQVLAYHAAAHKESR
jgi:hypothetical protein